MADAVATQPRDLPLKVTPENVGGGTFIVTGANTGLGFEAAKHLVSLGASKVILAVRNIEAGEKAKATIEADTGKTDVVAVWALDLASYDSVKAFANKAMSELDRIDAVIENAAVAMAERRFTEGHILPLTVNVLSTLLLGVLLLPKLSESAKKCGILPHIVFVTSRAGFDAKVEFEKIKDDPLAGMDTEETLSLKTYPLSKLMETFAVRELARLAPVERTGVVLNLVCPGLCVTELARNAPPAFKEMLKKQHELYGRTAEDGSRTLLFGAIAGKESHGCLTDSCEIADDKVPSWATDEDGRRSGQRVWELVVRELEIIEPGCVSKIL